jgi:hypothetical protein
VGIVYLEIFRAASRRKKGEVRYFGRSLFSFKQALLGMFLRDQDSTVPLSLVS